MNDETFRNIMGQYSVRAKRENNGQWVEGLLFPLNDYKTLWCIAVNPVQPNDFSELMTENIDRFVIDEKTICHYTGLTDKNGQKIWEHDFAFVTDGDGCSGQFDTGLGEIIFFDGLWYIDGHVQNALYDINRCFQIEVRGNAFDNPELLQEEEKDER